MPLPLREKKSIFYLIQREKCRRNRPPGFEKTPLTPLSRHIFTSSTQSRRMIHGGAPDRQHITPSSA